MAIDKTKILADGYSTEIIQKLSDNPNESGLNAEELKIAFDTGATHIRNYIKDSLIDDINGELETLGTADTTLSNEIGTLSNLTTTNKSNLVSAINEVNAKPTDTNWVNITASKGTWDYLRYRVRDKIVCIEGHASSYTWSGKTGDTFATSAIPEQYRLSGNNIYTWAVSGGKSISKIYLTANGNLGVDYVMNINDASNLTTSNWIQFKIIYFID